MAWLHRDGDRNGSYFSHRWIFHCSHFCLNDARLPQSSFGREGFPLNQPVEVDLYWAAPLTLKRIISYLMNRFLQSLTSRMVGFLSTASFPPMVLCWFAGGAEIWVEIYSIRKQPNISEFSSKNSCFLLQHTGADIYRRWDFTREGHAAPCLCITQEINESSSCRETSLFEVHRCFREQQFKRKKKKVNLRWT